VFISCINLSRHFRYLEVFWPVKYWEFLDVLNIGFLRTLLLVMATHSNEYPRNENINGFLSTWKAQTYYIWWLWNSWIT